MINLTQKDKEVLINYLRELREGTGISCPSSVMIRKGCGSWLSVVKRTHARPCDKDCTRHWEEIESVLKLTLEWRYNL